ncbi:hypothetical protein K1719_036245 [Acacia pycnantha]|nr:hypothetical protein K1719_036245 [Acacia pycnantha]
MILSGDVCLSSKSATFLAAQSFQQVRPKEHAQLALPEPPLCFSNKLFSIHSWRGHNTILLGLEGDILLFDAKPSSDIIIIASAKGISCTLRSTAPQFFPILSLALIPRVNDQFVEANGT